MFLSWNFRDAHVSPCGFHVHFFLVTLPLGVKGRMSRRRLGPVYPRTSSSSDEDEDVIDTQRDMFADSESESEGEPLSPKKKRRWVNHTLTNLTWHWSRYHQLLSSFLLAENYPESWIVTRSSSRSVTLLLQRRNLWRKHPAMASLQRQPLEKVQCPGTGQ